MKQFGYTAPNMIVDQDKGKVILVCNATLDKKFQTETDEQIKGLKRIADRFELSESKKP